MGINFDVTNGKFLARTMQLVDRINSLSCLGCVEVRYKNKNFWFEQSKIKSQKNSPEKNTMCLLFVRLIIFIRVKMMIFFCWRASKFFKAHIAFEFL